MGGIIFWVRGWAEREKSVKRKIDVMKYGGVGMPLIGILFTNIYSVCTLSVNELQKEVKG